MSFQWYGYDTGRSLIWEQEIKRYYFISEERVDSIMPHGFCNEVAVGTKLKITKNEAHTFFTKGYVKHRFSNWDGTKSRWDRVEVRLTKGRIVVETEKRELRQAECHPSDVARPKRKKK